MRPTPISHCFKTSPPASLDRLRRAGWSGTSALELVLDDHTERRGVRPRFACAVLSRGQLPSTVRA